MKTLYKIITCCFLFLITIGCQEDDNTLSTIDVPQNLTIETSVTDDGSGMVTFTASADNAITYKYVFTDGTSEVAPNGTYVKRFTKTGLNTYLVTVLAYGKGGVSSSSLVEVTVRSDFSDPEAVQFLTGGSSKTWFWAANELGHLGVGENTGNKAANYFGNYYQAAPFEKAADGSSSCLYEDQLVFSLNGETLQYELRNGGQTFFNASYEGVAGGSQGSDFCYDYDTSGVSTVNLAPSESVVAANDIPSQTRGTVMNFTNNNFMGYYVGASSYEILSLTDDRMVVRVVQANNTTLAWYHTFTTTKPVEGAGGPVAEEDTFPNLLWSDEFNVDGTPNAANWTYDLGTGDNGWGNSEKQYYTDRGENIIVADGVLKITAKRENFSGSNFTSSRIKTEGLQEFTFGRVEVRAKLPEGVGTWPAIWMLGADYADNPWPGAGEIDIMEHVGRNQNEVLSTLHFPGNSGANGISESTTVPTASTEFHVYAAEWTETQIRFYVDDELFHIFVNDAAKPFDKDFFLILNVAMGGNLGGDIAPDFTESSMEVDYVRVYQRD